MVDGGVEGGGGGDQRELQLLLELKLLDFQLVSFSRRYFFHLLLTSFLLLIMIVLFHC